MDKYMSKLSAGVDYGAGTFLLLVAVMSVLGNLSVLVTALKRFSKMKPPEMLNVNLAVTDVGMTISMYPLAITSAWSHGWLGGDSSCLYYGLMGFFFGVASIMTLTIMAVTRFVFSMNLRSPGQKLSKRNMVLLILFSWIYALIWAVLPLFGWGKYGPEPFGTSCTIAWSDFRVSGAPFIISMFILCTLIPAFTIIICYFGIVWRLHQEYKSLENGQQIPNAVKLERRLTAIAILVSLGFIGCWAPYAMVSFWSMFRSSDSIPPLVSLLPCLFAKSSTAYNPIIYYAFSNTFRKEVKQLMCFSRRPPHLLNTVNVVEREMHVRHNGERKLHSVGTFE
ncbi:opsin 8, group member b [Polypterus senegalus]|uniref:opsin 8, group member b n=1 Tax=Polypterus senegalus TaxID=55291 RepID=UPI0019665577|nr:opsin 8, group member b [Polypterus senegalus]